MPDQMVGWIMLQKGLHSWVQRDVTITLFREEHLNLILPSKPPFHPRQFRTCAVFGISGDLLKTEFGQEIDEHDAVFRDNETPIIETRYFSSPRKGHNPLQGRAYYQLLECLGIIRIHSPMRAVRTQDWSYLPSKESIRLAHGVVLRLKKIQARQLLEHGPFKNCKVWGTVGRNSAGLVSGSLHMSDTRKNSNYSKWELLPFESIRREAQEHFFQMGGVSQYKLDGNKLDDLVCIKHE